MLQDIKNHWSKTSREKKTFLIAGIVIVIGLFIYLSVWALKSDYQVLFADLDPQDAAHMVTELERLKTPYKIADNGTTILVEEDAVHRTRLKLMGKGLTLRGNVGFELFNNTDYGTTEFAQKVNFQRALQGELARTIMSIDQVKFARVHLVLPETGLLRKKQTHAKASISLIMKDDAPLSMEQVIGIQRLVSAAVPDMDTSAVTVLDKRGVALTPNLSDDDSGSWSSAKIAVKKEIEAHLTQKVYALLNKALGTGKATVSVDVTLNYDQIKVTREDVLPASGSQTGQSGALVRRRQSQQNGGGKSNYEASPNSQTTDTSSHATGNIALQTVDVEFQNGRRVEQVVSEPGNIRRISVGVLVAEPISDERLDELKEVVEMAAGLDAARGDAIAVHTLDVPKLEPSLNVTSSLTSPATKAQRVDRQYNWDSPLIGIVSVISALLLFCAIAFILMRRMTGQGARRLSEAEREKMLKQISDWVAASTVAKREAEPR